MDFSFEDVKGFIVRHYQYFAIGVAFLFLIIVIAIFHNKIQDGAGSKAVSDNSVSQNNMPGGVDVADVPLALDANEEVNALVIKYFNAMAAGDTTTLQTLCTQLDETEQIRIEKKATYTEAYDNYKIYSKPGPDPDSYIVFAYFQIKFQNIDTMAPGLLTLYVKRNEAGEYYIYNDELTSYEADYIKAISTQDDVMDVLKQVDTEYNQAADSNTTLKNFMEALPTALDGAVSEELASRQNAEDAEPSGGGEDAPAEEGGSKTASVKDTINVRKTASTEGDKLGQLMRGDTVTVIELLDNGWCKVDYQGNEAYVKSEYLNIDGVETTSKSEEEIAAEDGVIGKVVVKDGKTDINIRKSANSESDSVGKANGGDSFDLLMDLDSGWCRIKYNNDTAYIKTELVNVKKNN